MPKFKIKSRNFLNYLALAGLLLVLHFSGIIKPVESFLLRASYPLMEFFYSSGSKARGLYSGQVDKRDASLTIAELEQKNRKLSAENAELENLRQENEYLRNQLEFRKDKDYQYLMADIIARNDLLNNSAEEKSIIINKGSADGLKEGQAVLDGQGIVVGKIMELSDKSAKACLTIDERCKFAASIQNRDRTSGVAEGELGLTIKMDFIPQSEEIFEEDIVVTSGLEVNIPRGLAIGEVSEVIKENNELWQQAVIEPLADFDSLPIVSVVLQ